MKLDIKKIGTCVGSEIHGLTSWRGESIKYYGIFNINPKEVHLFKLRDHLTEAYSIDGEKPAGSIIAHSFILK